MSKGISETDKAWLAGFIDGEGSICLMFKPPNKKSGIKNPTWYLKVSIANTKKHALELVTTWYPSGTVIHSMSRKNNTQDCYQFVSYGRSACQILNDIYPYLKIKQKQADIALEYATLTKRRVGRAGTSKEHFQKKLDLALTMKELNKKGRIEIKHKWQRKLELWQSLQN